MSAQDQAILTLAAVGLVGAVITFFARRQRGKSRSIATVFAFWVFGAIVAAGVLFGFFPFSRHSMGLERVVVPFIIMIVTAISSVIFGLLVHLIDNRKGDLAEPISLEAQILIQEVEHDTGTRVDFSGATRSPAVTSPADASSSQEIPANLPAWKRFAIQASK